MLDHKQIKQISISSSSMEAEYNYKMAATLFSLFDRNFTW